MAARLGSIASETVSRWRVKRRLAPMPIAALATMSLG